MRLALTLLALVLAACAGTTGAPTDRFEATAPNQFRFVAPASMMQPLNSRQAEHARHVRLEKQLAARSMCANGYTIVSRDPPLFRESGTRYEHTAADITYVGACR
jgi:hypothetical protein